MSLESEKPGRANYDVIIVGGAIYGSALAWFLSNNPDFDGSVLVVEKDPSYQFSSTAHTNSCMRQQFSRQINVQISQFAADYVKNFRHHMGGGDRVPELPFHSYGYLFLADSEPYARVLRENQQLQASWGAGTRHMTPEQVSQAYPFYRLDDIVGANHNLIDEGYFDGNTMFDWWRRGAREQGVQYLHNEVVALNRNTAGNRVQSVTLKTSEVIGCGIVVNACGPRALATSRMAGIELPVEPRKRYTFVFSAERPLDRALPLTIDPSGVHMRSEGQYYLAGCPPQEDLGVAYDDFVFDHSLWEDKVWPIIAARIPQFDAIRLTNSWVGHYAFNTFDQNAILGPHSEVENFIFVNGFSGHGLQQSPAVGRGISELIIYGEYRSLDLSPFSFDRLVKDQPLVERTVI